MNTENLHNLRTDNVPDVDFFIKAAHGGLAAGFDPKDPIAGADLIILFGTGIWVIMKSIAEQCDCSVMEIWSDLQTIIEVVDTGMDELPDDVIYGGDLN